MKPISIKFKCFGPYMEEQFIDFRELEKSGLFLICGPTGSGKTTILDAICCALYGQSSGGSRGGLVEMRCKQAAHADATMVEYIFSSGRNTYRFYRAVKPKKQQQKSLEAGKPQGFNDECECQILREGQFVPMADTKATQTYVNGKAEEILGLKYDQFRQVVILPQGQFEKLLTSKSEDKENILQTLFHTQRWSEIAKQVDKKVKDEKRKLENEQTALNTKMEHFGCDSLQALRDLTEQTAQEAAELKKETEQLEKNVEEYSKAYDRAKADDNQFQDLEKEEKNLSELEGQKEDIEAKRTKLEYARQAESITPQYTAWQNAKDDAGTAAKEQADKEKKEERAKEEYQNVLEEQEAHEQKRPEFDENKKQLAVLKSRKELYQSLKGKKEAWDDAEKDKNKAENAVAKAKETLEKMEKKLEDAYKARRKAEEDYNQGESAYLHGISGRLAQKLEEGERCPVCGSIHHPKPACTAPDAISEKEWKRLKEENKKALDAVDDAIGHRNTADQEKQNAENEKIKCDGNAEKAHESYEEALKQRVNGIDNENQRAAEVERLEREIEAFEKADEDMTERVRKAENSAAAAKELAKDARKTAADKAEAEKGKRSEWDAAMEGKFPTEDDYLNACMETDEKDSLARGIAIYDANLKTARKKVNDKKAALGDAVRPNVEGAKGLWEQAKGAKDEKKEAYIRKSQAAEDRRETLKELEQELPDLEEKLQRNQEDEDFAKHLQGSSGVSLQRYVLGVMLTAITAQANRLLKNVYGGRYQLYRTDEASGKAHKKGLELVVVDRDGSRAVTSLSGGEKFLLSLSLAIGLAGVVQAQGKGVRMEAMFIDEGFGSLDNNCIDDAMEILESIRRSSGIVGIISHVSRLAETIPAKIEITKTSHGSTCKVDC